MTPERRAEIETMCDWEDGRHSANARSIIRELLNEIDLSYRGSAALMAAIEQEDTENRDRILFRAEMAMQFGKRPVGRHGLIIPTTEERDAAPPVKKSRRFTYDPITGTPRMERDSQ